MDSWAIGWAKMGGSAYPAWDEQEVSSIDKTEVSIRCLRDHLDRVPTEFRKWEREKQLEVLKDYRAQLRGVPVIVPKRLQDTSKVVRKLLR